MTVRQADISLEALEYEQLKRRARTNLLDFTMFCNEQYIPNWHHDIFAQVIDDFIFGDVDRQMNFMPAQNGKSELSTRNTAALEIGLNPDATIAIIAYSQDFASTFIRDIERIIDSPRYRELFPEVRLSGGPESGRRVRSSKLLEIVGHKGKIIGTSYSGALTGIKVDIAIFDDPYKNRKAANSGAVRKEVEDFLDDVLKKRFHNNSKLMITYTRWREDDIAGRELKFQKEGKLLKPYTICKFQALKDIDFSDPPEWHVAYDDPRKKGEALWPSQHSKESYLEDKATNPSSFEAMAQQNPTAKEGNVIKRHWFIPYNRADLPKELKTHLYVDTAQTEGELKKGDPCGILAYKIWKGDVYLVEFIKGRWGTTELCSQIVHMSEKHGMDRTCEVAIENKSNGESVRQELKQHTGLSIYMDNPKGGKLERVENEETFFESKRCYAPKSDMWWADFEHQCLGFPNLAHDEEVDCLTGAIRRGSAKRKRSKYGIANLKRN